MLYLLSAEPAKSISHKTSLNTEPSNCFLFALMKMVPIDGHKLVCCLVGVTAYSMVVTASFVSTGPEEGYMGQWEITLHIRPHGKGPERGLVENPHGNDLVE